MNGLCEICQAPVKRKGDKTCSQPCSTIRHRRGMRDRKREERADPEKWAREYAARDAHRPRIRKKVYEKHHKREWRRPQIGLNLRRKKPMVEISINAIEALEFAGYAHALYTEDSRRVYEVLDDSKRGVIISDFSTRELTPVPDNAPMVIVVLGREQEEFLERLEKFRKETKPNE